MTALAIFTCITLLLAYSQWLGFIVRDYQLEHHLLKKPSKAKSIARYTIIFSIHLAMTLIAILSGSIIFYAFTNGINIVFGGAYYLGRKGAEKEMKKELKEKAA